jgi:hypothetical protein
MAWVLILFMATAEGGASSQAIDMASYSQCEAARSQVVDRDEAMWGRDGRVVKLAICVERVDT